MDTPQKIFSSKQQLLPIGIDDYKDLIEQGCIYVDKTLLIKEFWDNKTKVLLVTRPRRFGKSITLSMLRHFFEKTRKSTSYLFEKSNIWKEERFRKIQGTLPVIFISFKDIKSDTWEEAYEALKDLLANEVYRALHSLESKMSNFHQEKYKALTQKKCQ